jgi:hypothetical protein
VIGHFGLTFTDANAVFLTPLTFYIKKLIKQCRTGYYFPNFPANFSLFAPSAAIDFPRVGEIFQFQVTEIEENSSGEVLCYFLSIFLKCG